MKLLHARSLENIKNIHLPSQYKQKCYFYNTFFYSKLRHNGIYTYKNVRRWSKRAKIITTEMDKIFIPIHVHGNHWCMSCINFIDSQFEYYDSLGGQNSQCLTDLRQYVIDEAKHYQQIDNYDFSQWKIYIGSKEIPKQQNGYDCGVFSCKLADYKSEMIPLNYTQNDMTYFRKRMIIEILQGNLL